MINIILSGANGTMGQVISKSIDRRADCKIVCGIDVNTKSYGEFAIFSTPDQCKLAADVIIDFSHPAAIEKLLEFATGRKIPIVVATTGLNESKIARVYEAARSIPVFYTANMSLGVNLMMELSKIAARILGDQFDIEVIEKHHNQKIDAPSGTALMLADGISSALQTDPQYVYDRHSQRKKRTKNEIGLHAIRGGTIVGEHEVLFAGQDETFSLNHAAHSKDVFATGALNAALFLSGKTPGLYNMADLINSQV